MDEIRISDQANTAGWTFVAIRVRGYLELARYFVKMLIKNRGAPSVSEPAAGRLHSQNPTH